MFVLFFIPSYKRPRLIVGLTLVPLLIMFNPILVSFLLQFTFPTVLWRFSYMFPVGVVIAMCCFITLENSALSRATKFFRLTPFGLLLFPIPHLDQFQFLRYPTLQSVNPGNSPANWDDLVKYISQKGEIKVLTDPVTGYVLSAMTKVRHEHNKFHETDVGSLRKYRYAPNTFLDYAIAARWFLIVNLRDGQPSANGRKSKHWPEDIMYVSRYYPTEMLEWLQIKNNASTENELVTTTDGIGKQLPAHMRLIWQKNNIWVFSLKRTYGEMEGRGLI